MFYDGKLMNCTTLGKAWKVANNIEISDNDVSLPRICEKLDEWLGSEEEMPCRRLSLRTSAIFIDGAAKLYRQGMQKLFEDIDGLDKAMSARKRHRSDITDSSESSTYTTSLPTPEKMMRRQTINTNLDTSQVNDIRTQITDVSETSGAHSPMRSNKMSLRRTFCGSNNNIVIREDNENSSSRTYQNIVENNQEIQTKEQEVQTTLSFGASEKERDRDDSSHFDENLPFGYVIIHDNYRSRIPSKIIFSSINPDVNGIF